MNPKFDISNFKSRANLLGSKIFKEIQQSQQSYQLDFKINRKIQSLGKETNKLKKQISQMFSYLPHDHDNHILTAKKSPKSKVNDLTSNKQSINDTKKITFDFAQDTI